MLTGLPPLISSHTRVLILGSFPGAASLASQQYYGHPQNQFWKILQAIWPSCAMPTGAGSYQMRSEWLLDRGLGLWDVYAACEREGSLDSQIRTPVLNDFAEIQRHCPALQAIAHNGAESFKHARRVSAALAGAELRQTDSDALEGRALDAVSSVGVQFYKLPSSSPAHAAWSFERKLAAWREVFEKHRWV